MFELPPNRSFAITPAASGSALSIPVTHVKCNNGGALNVRFLKDSVYSTLYVTSGEVLAGRITHIQSEGTTASSLVGFTTVF